MHTTTLFIRVELNYTCPSSLSGHTYLPKELHVNFGDPIDGSGSLHSDVGTRVARRGETKGTNCARAEETNIVDLTHVYHIVEATDVHLQSQRDRWTDR